MKKRLLIFLSAFTLLSASPSPESQAERASFWFDAGHYTEARNLYRKLLQETELPWQRDILHFNSGTTYLKEGQWELALQEFDTIDHPSALLNEHLQTNRALALLALVKQEGESSSPTLRLKQLKEALSGLEVSHAEPALVRNLKLEIELLQEREDALKRVQMPLIDLLAQLVATLEHDRKALSVLSGAQASDYLNQREKERAPYWKMLQNYPETYSVIEKALAQYQALEQARSRSQLPQTLSTLITHLNESFKNSFSDSNSFRNNLLLLRFDYAKALVDRIPRETLEKFEGRFPKMEGKSAPEMVYALTQLQLAHRKGMEALRADDLEVAHIWLSAAPFWLDRALIVGQRQTPLSQLDQAMQQLLFTQEKVEEAALLPSVEAESLRPLLMALTQAVQASASAFPQAVISEQQALYSKNLCQKEPWQGAMPPYFEGEEALFPTAGFLKEKTASLETVLEEQSQAYTFWKTARERLLSNPQQSSIDQPQASTFQETVERLQQMDSEDRPSPSKEFNGGGVERPW